MSPSKNTVMINRKKPGAGMFQNLKLGHKFFLSLMAISIVPLAVVSIFNYHYSKSQLQKSTIGNLRVINDSRAIHINHLIQLRQEQAKELAGTFISRQLQAGGFNDRETIQLIQAQIDSIFNELKFTPTSHYKNIDQASDVENISIWDIHGNVIADTNKEMVGKRMPFEFLQILYDKGAYFGGFEKDAFTGENYLTILEEIRSLDSHEYAGVLFIKTNAKILNDITTAREGFGKTAETYLVDKERRMITESRFIKDAVLKTRVNTIGVDACFNGRKAPMIYKNYQGRHVLGVQKYLPDQEWCISTEMDVREAFEPTITFRNQIFFIVGCLIFFIYIFVHLAGRAFIQPILALRDASKEVAKGNYHLEVNLRNQDELGELSGAFNEMTKNLSRVTSELEEKNKKLQHLDQVKSEFVSTVSHELRTPMTIIRESISQVLNGFYGGLTELQKNMLSMAHNNIDRLGRIINNLLDISKIEDGKIALNRETVDLVSLVREVGAGFDSYVGKKGLAVKYEFSDNIIEGYVDRDKIIQAFTNLIGNAVKFTMKGHITVSVTRRKSYIECFVADTGRGIAAEDLPKVFGKFQQFGRPSGTAEKGTGLGLTISKGLVELHGGKIWLESKLDEGTKFIFTLPYPPKA